MEKRSNSSGTSSMLGARAGRKGQEARRKMLLLASLSGLGVLCSAVSMTHAQIVVANPSFETPTLATGADNGDGNVPGWTKFSGYADIANPGSNLFPPGTLDGSNFLEMNQGITYQNLGTMVVGQTYHFDITYGWRQDIPQYEANQFAFVLRPNLFSSSAYAVSKSANFGTGYPTSPSVTSAPLPSGTGVLVDDVLSYTATAADNGQPLTLQMQVNDLQLCIDDVKLTTTSAAVDPTQLFFTGASSGSFDTTTANNFALTNGSSAAFTSDGTKTVTFNDNRLDNGAQVSNTSIVVQNGGVLPLAVNVATNTVNYTFTDLDGTHGIGGSASFTKTGSSTVFLNGSNSYTGGTTINAGTVSVNNNTALGNGPVNFPDTATLKAGASVTLANNFNLGGGSTTFDTNGNTLTLTGSITNTPTAGLPATDIYVLGNGTLNLAGTLNVISGSVDGKYAALSMAVTGTVVNITGTGSLTDITMGVNGTVNTLNLNPAGTLNFVNTDGSLDVGQGSAASQSAVYQTGGTVNMSGNFNLARWDGSAASYSMTGSGSVLNIANGMNIGGYGAGAQSFGANSVSLLTQSAGTINVSGQTVQSIQSGGTSVAYLSGGTYNNTTNAWIVGNAGGSNSSLTVTGTAALNTGSIVLANNSNGSTVSVLNLNGGVTTTGSITGAGSTSTSIVNFNGGTLIPSGSNTAFMSGLTAANIYSGGAIIDTGSKAITIAQALSSANGSSGLNNAGTVSAGGSGYVGAPVVTVVNGGGTGATAVAIVTAGVVTGVTITNPGTGYTSTPSFNISGGGGTGATLTAPAPTPNANDGGLVKKGSGVLTLSGSNTYHGATQVLAGTLQIAGPGPALPVVNPNFTATVLAPGSFQYGPSEPGGWNYYSDGGATAGAGLITNNAPFNTNGTIPGSSQAAFIQRMGAIDQVLNFPTAGIYTLTFQSEQRPGQSQALDVQLDDPNNGGYDILGPSGLTPGGSWQLQVVSFYESAGNHDLAIVGLDTAGGDNTAYVTGVSLIAPYSSGTTNAIPDSSPVVLSSNTTLDVNNSIETTGALTGPLSSTITLGSGFLTVGGDGSNATFTGSISGAGGFGKTGAGVQTLNGTNNYSGGTNVSGGTLIFSTTAAFPGGPTAIGKGALLVLPAQASVASATSMNVNGSLIVHNGSYGAIATQLAAAYNAGAWNGPSSNFSSTAANTDTSHLTAIGELTGKTGTFEGQAVSASDVLVKYTYYGDANLDGQVTSVDYTLIDSGYLTGATGWQNGDFNYDHVINGSDYTLIDNAFNTQGAAISTEIAGATAQIAGSVSAVPEPASVSLLALCAAGLLGRRRAAAARRIG